jgi:hypothetical protein
LICQRLLNSVGNDLEGAVNRFYEQGIPLEAKKSTDTSLIQRKTSSISNWGRKTAWLIGRRIAYGYTLNSGNALRAHSLHFKFEGQLLEKSKKQFFSSKLKQKQKFSAANLLFECGQTSRVNFSFFSE